MTSAPRSAFLDNWAETDQELFDESIDRFPEQPEPGESALLDFEV